MKKTCRIAIFILCRKTATLLFCGIFLTAFAGCPQKYSDEKMQPLAATASDLARAVMQFAQNHPAEAAAIDDRELVRRATAYDPSLLKPYAGLVVRGTPEGVILVCSGDGKRTLFEDAECTDKVDKPCWSGARLPCQFTLNLDTVCP